MLPQVERHRVHRAVAFAMAAAMALAGCTRQETPEAQVRAVIAAGVTAAEARDAGGLLEHVSATFTDDDGGGREELGRHLRGYLLTHRSVHVITYVESVEFPYRDYARVQVKVGALGREAADASPLATTADLHDVMLEMQLEEGRWKVKRAAW